MKSTPSLPRPPHLVYRACAAGGEVQQTEWKDSEPRAPLETSVPPPGEGHGANSKGASHLKPCYSCGCPCPVTLARSESEITFSVFTTTAHLGLLSLRVTFPLTYPYFYSSLLALWSRILQFLSPNGHPEGWAHSSFGILLPLSPLYPKDHQPDGGRGPSSLFGLILATHEVFSAPPSPPVFSPSPRRQSG